MVRSSSPIVAAAFFAASLAAGAAAQEQARPLVFNEPHLPDGLRLAQRYAASGSAGFVVSLPQLFAARVKADFGNAIWNNWYTTFSEESVVKDARVSGVNVQWFASARILLAMCFCS